MTEKEYIFQILSHYKRSIEEKGHKVYAIMLKGSQNYNLHDEHSDIDANAILIPQLHQINKTRLAEKYTFETGEVMCHDVYSFAEIVAKGNPQWIEVCHTEYKIGGDISFLQHHQINPSSLKGMAYEKVKAFDKPYPSKEEVIKDYGYDPKQLHHIIRLYDLLKHNTPIYKYEGESRDFMMSIKRSGMPVDAANQIKDEYMQKIVALTEERRLTYTPQKIDYDALNKIVIDENLGRKTVTRTGKTVFSTAAQLRTFGGEMPRFIKSHLPDELKAQFEGQDLNVNVFIEIEEL